VRISIFLLAEHIGILGLTTLLAAPGRPAAHRMSMLSSS
jgi:hypothetical protein